MASEATQLAGYQSAIEDVIYRLRPDLGYLRLTGPDRVDFMQRQTTNDVNLLAPERVVRTVLTSATARIMNVFTLLHEPDEMGVVPLSGMAAAAEQYLNSRIFFMDDVAIENLSSQFVQVDIDGPAASRALAIFDMDVPVSRDQLVRFQWAGQPVWVMGRQGLFGDTLRVLMPANLQGEFISGLRDLGYDSLSDEAFDVLRIESGLPVAGHELTEDYNPLEVGLSDTVSDTKGCYTGQEIIARQITYDKVVRRLVGLKLDRLVPEQSRIRADGKPVGTLTSVTESPRFGPIALAVVKRPYDSPGSTVHIQLDGGLCEAVTTGLPFRRQ